MITSTSNYEIEPTKPKDLSRSTLATRPENRWQGKTADLHTKIRRYRHIATSAQHGKTLNRERFKVHDRNCCCLNCALLLVDPKVTTETVAEKNQTRLVRVR